MLANIQAIAHSLQPHSPTRYAVYGVASAHMSSNGPRLWRGHKVEPSATSTLRARGLSVPSFSTAARRTVRLTARVAPLGSEDGASQEKPSEDTVQSEGEGSGAAWEGEEAEASAAGAGRRRRRRVNISALLSTGDEQGGEDTPGQESLEAGPTLAPPSGSFSSPALSESDLESASEHGFVSETQTLEVVGAIDPGLEDARATSSAVSGGRRGPLPGSNTVSDILAALETSSSDTYALSTGLQAQAEPLSVSTEALGSPVQKDAEGQLVSAQKGEGELSEQEGANASLSPGSSHSPVAARLRRSLFDALRSARAQHTEAGALRVMDAWWEPAHRSSASVDALLGAVMELEASEERKTLRQLLDWIVHVRRVNLPGTPAYNLLLGAAARAMADGPASSPRGIRRVELIFQEMLRVAVPADEETFEILMGVFARAGQHERATAAHRLMMSSGLKPTKPVLQMLLKAYCSAKDFPAAQQVMWDLSSADGGLTVEDMNLYLFALSREGRAADIEAMLDRVLGSKEGSKAPLGTALRSESEPAQGEGEAGAEQGPQLPAPNSASLRALLRAYASQGEHARAGEVLDLVKKHRVTPDPKLLSELVSSFAVCGSPTEAEATLLWAWGCGYLNLKPDTRGAARDRERGGGRGGADRASVGQENALPLYTSLVFAYARQKLWAEALDVISEMRRVMPSLMDERPYNVVMGEMASAGEARRAQGMLAAMEAQGLPPKASSFRTLARAFCIARMPEKAEDILLEMQQRGWRVSEEAVVPLLDAYALCRRPGEVERVVANLDAFGLTKTPAICSSLIGSFCLMGLPRAAESVFSQAFPQGERRPTPLACAWLIAAHVALGNEEAALRVANLMEALGMPAPRGELAQVVDVHVAAGKTKEAQVISNYLRKVGLSLRKSEGSRQKWQGRTRDLQLT